jgi:molybdopterin-synthase adenylyltransferase
LSKFNYNNAFSRNIGWVTAEEQLHLKSKKIAIAGLGGVGGQHLLTLTRLGIGNFNIADMDAFEVENFNRQAGATISNIGAPKAETMAKMAKDINPEINISIFDSGINNNNLDNFFEGCDLYIDGLDFFALDIRQLVFKYTHSNNIPAITAAPLGLGAAVLVFMPNKMDFDTYFGMSNKDKNEQLLRFLVGLSPKMLQNQYLVEPSSVDLANQKGPSTSAACNLCAGIAASAALKILLNRGKIMAAPHGIQIDGYTNQVAHTWRPLGAKNPLSKLMMMVAKKKFGNNINNL